jgi:hypothetical protein
MQIITCVDFSRFADAPSTVRNIWELQGEMPRPDCGELHFLSEAAGVVAVFADSGVIGFDA